MREISLVAFTLLSQTAVGTFWVSGVLSWVLAQQPGSGQAGTLAGAPLWLASAMMLLALAASFLHLGTPHRAWRALANLRSSWLSREVLFALLFGAASTLVAVMNGFGWGTTTLHTILCGIGAVLGLALLTSMANAYRLRTIPAWNSWVTPVTFLITALLLGGLVTGVLLGGAASGLSAAAENARWWLALGATVLLGSELLVTLQWIARNSAMPGAASRAAARVTREHGRLFRVRLVLMVAAIVASGLALLPLVYGEIGTAIPLVLALALALIAEVLGRLLFYEARVRYGV